MNSSTRSPRNATESSLADLLSRATERIEVRTAVALSRLRKGSDKLLRARKVASHQTAASLDGLHDAWRRTSEEIRQEHLASGDLEERLAKRKLPAIEASVAAPEGSVPFDAELYLEAAKELTRAAADFRVGLQKLQREIDAGVAERHLALLGIQDGRYTRVDSERSVEEGRVAEEISKESQRSVRAVNRIIANALSHVGQGIELSRKEIEADVDRICADVDGRMIALTRDFYAVSKEQLAVVDAADTADLLRFDRESEPTALALNNEALDLRSRTIGLIGEVYAWQSSLTIDLAEDALSDQPKLSAQTRLAIETSEAAPQGPLDSARALGRTTHIPGPGQSL